MTARALVLLGLAGCDVIFPLTGPTAPVDDAAIPPDAFRPLVPPPAGPPCGPRPPFESFTYSSRALVNYTGQIINPTFTGPDRVMFTNNTGTLFETSLVGPPVEVIDLALTDGTQIRFPGATPDGNMIWFTRFAQVATPSVGTYYALREGGTWTATRTDFGITAHQLIPSNVGFHAGTARMIVALEPQPGSGLRLVELSTPDGLTWTELSSLPFSDGTSPGGDFDPSISADGCVVLFRREGKIFVASRDPVDDQFKFVSEVMALAGALDPAIDPSGQRVWAIVSSNTIEEGIAP